MATHCNYKNMQRPHSSLQGALQSGIWLPPPHLVELFAWVIALQLYWPCWLLPQGLCISHALDPHPWQACSGHTCAWLILLIIKASGWISLSQEANPTTVSATVLCNAPITLYLFTLSEDLQGKYHHFKLSYVVISWGRGLAHIVHCCALST